MGRIKRWAFAIARPQLMVITMAILAVSAGQAGRGYHLSNNAMVNPLQPRPISKISSRTLPPETGLQLPPKPLSFSIDCSRAPCLALTFDDGPDESTTPIIVEALEKNGAKATFFVIGSRIAGHEALLQRMQDAGFDIGNHSWSHVDLTQLKPEQILEQINSTDAALRTAGIEPARLFRPPYGAQNETVRKSVPMPIILWNLDPKDWHEQNPQTLATYIESIARPGGIVVMHDTEASTVSAISDIIRRLSQHYQLVTISQLIQLPPDARGDTVIH